MEFINLYAAEERKYKRKYNAELWAKDTERHDTILQPLDNEPVLKKSLLTLNDLKHSYYIEVTLSLWILTLLLSGL